ncbi:AMP-binding protein [Vagococcus sp. PNs007]|uniref:AMP-binding protein n=1 Tax=Vagococcus proximus TaxID=2991417 RepID=A0ABT5X008_9ENTE|nr:AMP-binding protein [Vagococcus proximus]
MFLNIDQKKPEKIALLDDTNKSITYGELVKFCNDLSEKQLQRGLVLCLCDNSVDSAVGYISLIENKLVPIMLSVNTDPKLIESFIKNYEPMYIFSPKSNEYISEDSTKILSYGEFGLVSRSNNIDDLNENLSILLPTSGSTGSPKLVRYKYGNLESNAENVAKGLKWTDSEIGFMDLPMNYTMSLNVINVHLWLGARVVLTKHNILSREYWSQLDGKDITNITGVPFSYELLEKLGLYRKNLPKLNYLCQGGGKLPNDRFKSLTKYAKETNKYFIPTFGTTETSARMSFLPSNFVDEKIGSIGKPFPYGKMYLIDEDNNEITNSDVRGELVYEGPNVTMGYAMNKSDLLLDDEWCGKYITGDYASIDEDGFFYIQGRKSRFLKLLGHRVSLDQTELLIKDEFKIECACTGTDECMVIYITDSEKTESVHEFVSKKMDLYMGLFKVKVISEIPRNEAGKTMYKLLK